MNLPPTIPLSTDANMLPPELLETPQPVIGFVGLDCNQNLTHKSIWDTFNTNRKTDRAAIQFKLLATNYELPVVKPKRQSYEWYQPKGIFKRNWILKHLHVLPAVVVLFQDMEWNDPDWMEKQYQCVSSMQTIKNSIQGRHTKLAIVLLQKNTNADETFSSDRITTLATKCEINPKMIFVFPYNDNLMGYTLRLESAFLEHAQSYYLQSSKHVRGHRDQLSSHLELKIRHQFKLGFYAEMRVDQNTALKHYNQAYEWLEELKMTDSNCLEIKVIAGFLNYKMCKLMFNIGSPRDAITQFRAHIDKFRNRVGYKELLFEHFAWLSVQYSAFADLFCDAIKCGLPALQTQHPGIYYHKSAEYMAKRKESYQQICHVSSPLIDFIPPSDQNAMNYSNILYSDFFGVRGGNRSDVLNEQQIIAIVQQLEKFFNHSTAYITLLGQAMAQFKIYKCPRFRKKLAIEMAEEYLKVGDASKALTLYSLMLSEYRSEKWNIIFSQVLLKTLRSAFLSASIPDFIACSLECLSEKIVMKRSERIVILENLWKVFQKVPPLTQSQIVPELHMNWEKSLETFNTKLSFDLDKLTKIFDCNVKFKENRIENDEMACVDIFIRSVSDVPIKVQEFVIILSDSKSLHRILAKQCIEISDLKTENIVNNEQSIIGDIMIQPSKLYKVSFNGERYQFNENTELRVVRLEIKIGTSENFIILNQSLPSNSKNNFNVFNERNNNFANDSSTCYVKPQFHLKTETTLSHQFMLTNEYFGVTIRIENPFDMIAENVSLLITVPVHLRNKVFIASDLTKSRQKLLSHLEVNIGDINSKSSKTKSFCVISLVDGTLELKQIVRYQIVDSRSKSLADSVNIEENATHKKLKADSNVTLEYIENAIHKSKRETIVIPCVAEFGFLGQFFTLNKQPLIKAVKHEDFLFQIELLIKSTEIDILDIFLITDYNFTEKPYGKSRRKHNRSYQQGEKVHDVFLLHAEQTSHLKTLPKSKSIVIKAPNNTNVADALSLFSDENENLENIQQNDEIPAPKTIYNHAIDGFNMIESRKGILNANAIGLNSKLANDTLGQVMGIYCVRWRRTGETNENESKFLINSIEIVEAPLNIHCYLDETMYVKVPMTLLISLRNTTNLTLYLKTGLKNADNFMFAGHSQFNISLFAQSTYKLEFNLYPLKSGWQNLPEFVITSEDSRSDLDLRKLVERWMPKKVFILPMVKDIKSNI